MLDLGRFSAIGYALVGLVPHTPSCLWIAALRTPAKTKLGFWCKLTLTPALSHRMGEGESFSVGRRIQPLLKRKETGLAVPSPVGRERVRVRVAWLIHASCPTLVFAQTLRILWRVFSLSPGRCTPCPRARNSKSPKAGHPPRPGRHNWCRRRMAA